MFNPHFSTRNSRYCLSKKEVGIYHIGSHGPDVAVPRYIVIYTTGIAIAKALA